jgi:hypothetical protein
LCIYEQRFNKFQFSIWYYFIEFATFICKNLIEL